MSDTAVGWPDGARVAVLVSVLLETWAEGRSPTYFPRTTPLKAGTRDDAGIQWSQYGPGEGIWRLMRIVESQGIAATAFCNGLSAEQYPDAVARLASGGHEIAAHGFAQSEYLHEQGPAGQAATIERTVAAIERACGKRPTGWLTPVYGGDKDTVPLLAKAGLQWHCYVLDSSCPRIETHDSHTMVGIPWSEFVDNRVLRSSPRDYFDVYKGTFDYLHRNEPGSVLHIGIHAHFGGRPLIAAVFNEVLAYVRRHDSVWFPTCSQLAAIVAAAPAQTYSYRQRFFPGNR